MKLLSIFICLILTFITSPQLLAEGEDSSGSNVQYIPLKPAIITNYQSKRLSYIKAEITLQVTGEATATAIDRHLPYIRHNLVMLFSRQVEADLATSEGKLKLRTDALAEVVSVLKSEDEASDIDAILFTSFIVE